MQETAHTFCPSRCAASVLCLLWCACSFGVLSIYGLGLRGGCGVLFTAVLLWLSYLDLRDGMLYDCITMPFAVLGLMASGRWAMDSRRRWELRSHGGIGVVSSTLRAMVASR